MDENDGVVELGQLTALELAARFASGATSPVEALMSALERIDRLNPKINAYCFIDAKSATAAAAESARRWQEGNALSPVDGVPTGIKDNIDVRGWPTRRGSRLTPPEPAAQDAPVVARLRQAGCVFIGKTAMPEFGWKGVTDSPLTGITRNPLQPSLTPGGSSGGAAAALLIGGTPIQIGTDGGGSIRIPAAFTGIFGLKPSAGRVHVHPTPPLGSLFHIGPMTRTARDAAAVLAILAPEFPERMPAGRGAGPVIEGLRVAVADTLPHVSHRDDEIAGAVHRAAEALTQQGARLAVVAPPIDARVASAWETLWWDAAACTVAGFGAGCDIQCDPGLRAGVVKGLAQDRGAVVAAMEHAEKLKLAMARFHDDYDVLLTPAVTCRPFEVGYNAPPCGSYGQNWWDWAPFCQAFNLTGQPAAAVPVGRCPEGLPLAVQVSGPVSTDMTILAVAMALETVFTPAFPRL